MTPPPRRCRSQSRLHLPHERDEAFEQDVPAPSAPPAAASNRFSGVGRPAPPALDDPWPALGIGALLNPYSIAEDLAPQFASVLLGTPQRGFRPSSCATLARAGGRRGRPDPRHSPGGGVSHADVGARRGDDLLRGVPATAAATRSCCWRRRWAELGDPILAAGCRSTRSRRSRTSAGSSRWTSGTPAIPAGRSDRQSVGMLAADQLAVLDAVGVQQAHDRLLHRLLVHPEADRGRARSSDVRHPDAADRRGSGRSATSVHGCGSRGARR